MARNILYQQQGNRWQVLLPMNEVPVGSCYRNSIPQRKWSSYKNQKFLPVEGRRDMENHYRRDLLTKALTEGEKVTLHSLLERASMWVSITGNTTWAWKIL